MSQNEHTFQPEKKGLRQNLLRGRKYELIFAVLYHFQTKILEYSCRKSIWQFFFFLLLVVNDTLKQQTTALEGLPATICLMQTGILLRWNGVAIFFHQGKNWLHKNVLCWLQYKLIFATLYVLQMSISGRKLPLIRSMMLISFDHKHYVETEKRQLRPKVSRHNFFHKNQHLKYQSSPKASCQHGK